jgi:hypothetical protein
VEADGGDHEPGVEVEVHVAETAYMEHDADPGGFDAPAGRQVHHRALPGDVAAGRHHCASGPDELSRHVLGRDREVHGQARS